MVMKEAPDVDFYVEWSSVVEAPTACGTRDEIARVIGGDVAERLARCDATGTTSLWVETAGMRDRYPEEGAWDDDSFIYMQLGILTRAGVFELARRPMGADVSDLLTPFEDDAEVARMRRRP